MTRINLNRLFLSGLFAAVVVFILSGFLNGLILSGEYKAWAASMGSALNPPSNPMPLWALLCLIHGIALVWAYVGIRPRFGAGPKTAVIAAALLWFAAKLATAVDLYSIGILTPRLLLGQTLGGLVIFVAGALAGAWAYRE